MGVLREAESSGVAASVEDQSRTSTTTTTTAGHSSCSRTSTTPTTGTSRIILTTRTTRTATRIHLTTLLNTATGTVRSTAAMQLPQSELAPESILLAELYDRPFGGARIQPEKRLQVAILALLAVALAAPGLCSSARASAWELDPAATRIAFSVKNLSVAYVDGTFRLASGRVVLDDENLSRSTIEAVIDAGSVDTDEPKRDTHLRTADFLDVTRYPTIAFRSTRIEQAYGDHWKVTGDLTLRETTRPVVLDVQGRPPRGDMRAHTPRPRSTAGTSA